MNKVYNYPIEILLVEDNPGDVRLTMETLKDCKLENKLIVLGNGIEALAYLHKEGRFQNAQTPDLILLDLNLPKKDGREVLEEIKKDEKLKNIPVLVLTVSKSEKDILKTYNLQANDYLIKPIDMEQFSWAMKLLGDFWYNVVNKE